MYINSHLSANIGMKIVHCTAIESPISSDYQFYLIQKGAVIVEMHGEKIMLQKDDIILIKPNDFFKMHPHYTNTIIGIRLDSAYINSLIPIGYTIECNSTKGLKKNFEYLTKIIIEICTSFYEDDNETKMASLILCLTDCIRKNFLYKLNSKDHPNTDIKNQERINEIAHLIQTHYTQPLSLSTLAAEMYLTPQYLSKFIKKYLGVSFSRYLIDIRLDHAHVELLQTDNSIINIALNNGFPNVASFNKAFRETYHCSPSAYRHTHSKKSAEDTEVQIIFSETNKYPLFKKMITSDANNPIHYSSPWNDTINIGQLSNALSTNFQDTFKKYYKSMPVKYVRFENIFSKKVLSYDKTTDQFDFANIDEAFNFFHDMNIYLFIDLSHKLDKNHLENSQAWHSAEKESENTDINFLYKALSSLLKHCLYYYGTEYVSKWRFEVSASHDEYLNYSKSPSLYIKKYKGFYTLIKNLVPSCKIGGPGFNMCSDISVFENYIHEFSTNKVHFDFISLIAYSYEIKTSIRFDDPFSQGILSPDKDYIYNNFKKYGSIIKKSTYAHIPTFITDFGSTLGLHNYIYDSMFQANFICKTILSLLDFCPCIAYRSFWDTIPALSFLEDIYYSTSSMISKKGIPKPSLYAYTLLSRLGKKLVSHGDAYILTCDTAYKYQLLVYNYVHYNKNFCFNSWDSIRLENTYEIFEDSEPLEIHFICTNMLSGRYKVTQLSLNRNYGSALDKYLRILDKGNTTSSELLTTILNFTEDEAAYYRQTSMPRQDIYYINCENQLELDIKLTPHEIQFFELTKII